MKSRQINFFMTQGDQVSLMQHFGPLGELALIEGSSQDRQPKILESAEIRQMGAEPVQIFLARQKDINNILFKELKNVTYAKVDVVRSPVVEFDRCYQDQHVLRRGRLYFIKSYYDRQVMVTKDSSFVEWGDALISIARKVLTKDRHSFFYFGPEALRLKDSGTEMAQM